MASWRIAAPQNKELKLTKLGETGALQLNSSVRRLLGSAMRETVVVVLAVLASGCTGSKAPPCSSSTGRTVTVEGVAAQQLKPDGVSFSVGVETRAVSVAEAFSANARTVERVLGALKQAGVGTEELQTSALDVDSLTSNSGALTGFSVSTRVSVRRGDVSAAPSLLQAAVAAGANQVGSLRFFVADPAAFRKKGLELAIQDARSKAEALAALSGRTLGDIVCVSDQAGQDRDAAYDRLAGLGYVSRPTLEAGSQQLTSAVSVVFELK